MLRILYPKNEREEYPEHGDLRAVIPTCDVTAFFNPETSILILKRRPYTGNLNTETSGDSKKAFQHCGDVLVQLNEHHKSTAAQFSTQSMNAQIEGSAHELQEEDAWYTGQRSGYPLAHLYRCARPSEDQMLQRHILWLNSFLHTLAGSRFRLALPRQSWCCCGVAVQLDTNCSLCINKFVCHAQNVLMSCRRRKPLLIATACCSTTSLMQRRARPAAMPMLRALAGTRLMLTLESPACPGQLCCCASECTSVTVALYI